MGCHVMSLWAQSFNPGLTRLSHICGAGMASSGALPVFLSRGRAGSTRVQFLFEPEVDFPGPFAIASSASWGPSVTWPIFPNVGE